MLTKKDVNPKSIKIAENSSPHSIYSEPKNNSNADIKNNNLTSTLKVGSKKGNVTQVVIKCDVGFGNQLFIRGTGANLSWDKGTLMNNISSNEWLWETTVPFNSCEFKVLLNDFQFELGDNHFLDCGSNIQYSPNFQ